MGAEGRILPGRRGSFDLRGGAHIYSVIPNGRVQQPRLVQRWGRGASSVLGLLHQLRPGRHAINNATGMTEGMLFKYGSGTGSNLSGLRSSKEHLSTGGKASGPVSFMKGYDAFAGVIKSGGRTRRAAKMVILNADHPDIVEFIWSKANEEKKAWA